MKRKIVLYSGHILRQKAHKIEKITDEVRQLVQDMIDIVEKSDNILGIAANQVGVLYRIFVIKPVIQTQTGEYALGPTEVYINPELTDPSDKTDVMAEGCLSFPNLHLDIERPIEISVKAMNVKGKIFEEKAFGFKAREIMHENDHINGVLFIDRIKDRELRKQVEPILKKIKKMAQRS